MNRKLLFFDIDGTLLDTKTFTVSESTKNTLKKAKENGHLIFINTGRTRSVIDECIEELDIDGYICGCGTYISYGDDILYHHKVDDSLCHKIIELVDKYKVYCIFEAKDRIYFQKDMSDPIVYAFYKLYEKNGFPLGFIEDDGVHMDKFCIQFYHDVEPFYKEIENDFEIIRRTPDFSEIVPLNHSKATGIQFLIDHFHLSLDDCYVFGDSFNDEPMLSYVNHSIVMKNGDKELFEIAEYVTDDIDHDGIEKALKHYKLI